MKKLIKRLFFVLTFCILFLCESHEYTMAENIDKLILSQPLNQSVKVGEKVSFKVEASGDSLQYQWQVSMDGKNWKDSTIGSGKTAEYTFYADKNLDGRLHRCVVTDAAGNKEVTKEARLNVIKGVDITKQPSDQIVNAGEKVLFKVEASGDSLKYQWQVSMDGKNWKDSTIGSGKTAEYTFYADKNLDGRQHRCVVTDEYGNIVITKAAFLWVDKKDEWELPII